MKQAKDFVTESAGEKAFDLNEENAETKAQPTEEKVVLDIGRSQEKIKIKQKGDEKTGNAFLDIFKKINDVIISMNKVTTSEKAVFFRLLAVNVNAGIPIIKSLHMLAEQNKKNPKFQNIIADMAFKIEEGESLSGGMEKYPKIFNESDIGMIRSGEVSGHLNEILKDLATDTEKADKTARKVKGALTYPVVVLVILTAVLTLMMTSVIPNMTKLFVKNNVELPTITIVVMAISDALRFNMHYILGALAVFGTIFTLWKRSPKGKYQWHMILLHIPVIGSLLKRATLAQFARALGNLLNAGVSIIQTMTIISNAMKNEVYKRKLKYAGDDIKTGIPLAETLKNSKYFPAMLVNMIEVGEQTAQLESIAKKVATFYDEQVDDAVKGLTKVIEPIIMVVVGVAVGGLIGAVMLPMMSLADAAGNI